MSHLAERLRSKRLALKMNRHTAAQVIGISYCSLCDVEQGKKIGPRIGPKILVFLTTRYEIRRMPDGTIKATPKA